MCTDILAMVVTCYLCFFSLHLILSSPDAQASLICKNYSVLDTNQICIFVKE